MRTVYQETSDRFDNETTGYYATEEQAIAAYWRENVHTDRECEQAHPYTVAADADSAETIERARELAAIGSPSPALDL